MDKIKFATPDISFEEISRTRDVIESRWLTAGPVVREFEKKIAEISGQKKAVAFDSCTGAMEMSLRVLGIGDGDEVITTPYTYSATAEVIRNVGAKIVFVDLDETSFEMDYNKVKAAITDKTKAIMPVDIAGKLCNYKALSEIVSEASSIFKPTSPIQEAMGRPAIVADAAHSFGANDSSGVCGTQADFTCFSFHVLKNITTGGEGGAVVWNSIPDFDEYIEDTLRLLGDHGQTSRDKSKGWEYDIALFGYNSIMTNIDAGMGLAQLGRLSAINAVRRLVTKRYDDLFSEIYGVKPLVQHIGKNYQSAMHLYPIRLLGKGDSEDSRNKVYRILYDAGVPCNVHYKPLPMMTAYKNIGFDIKDFPNAYNMFKSLLTIPYHTELSAEQQEYIVQSIEKAVTMI